MRSIATIDRQPAADSIAVWLTSRLESTASHGNAVVVDLKTDPRALAKIHLLTRTAVVLATPGSDLRGLPIDGEPLTIADLGHLLDETAEMQGRIHAAVHAYAVRPNPKTGRVPKSPRRIVHPSFPRRPLPDEFVPAHDTPAQRALATANYLKQAWNDWLATEQERCQRTVSPKGETPWMMPAELGSPVEATFPEKFRAQLHAQDLT